MLTNPNRRQFIDQPTIQKVIHHCPSNQWKLIIGLARFGGLRIQSELVNLTWDSINWEKGIITVQSSKTKHIEGRESREVPLFPEIKTLLLEALKDAPIGEKRIIPNVDSSTNLRQGLIRIIKRAGVPVGRNLFNDLRASRITELCKDYTEK